MTAENSQKEKDLKIVRKRIWWLETKLTFFKFISTNYVAGKISALLPTFLFFICYFPVKDFIINLLNIENGQITSFIIAILFIIILLYYLRLLDKRYDSKIQLLERDLKILHKKEMKLINKINQNNEYRK